MPVVGVARRPRVPCTCVRTPVEVSARPRNLGAMPKGLGPHPQTTLPIVDHEGGHATVRYPRCPGPREERRGSGFRKPGVAQATWAADGASKASK